MKKRNNTSIDSAQKNQGYKSLTKNYQRFGNDLKIHIRSLNHLYSSLIQFFNVKALNTIFYKSLIKEN